MLGVLLAGIVAMQVEVLKMSSSIGRSIAYSSALQSQNEQLRASVASLGDDQRIMRLAVGMGLVMPHVEMVGFLSRLPQGSLQAATGNIHSPDATTFLNSTPLYPTPTNGQVVTASSLATSLAYASGGGVSSSPGVTTGQSTSGQSSSTSQTPALTQSPASGSSTGAGSNTAGGGGSNSGTGGGTGTGNANANGTGTGTANGGGTTSGGGASLTGGTGIQSGGGTQTTPSGG